MKKAVVFLQEFSIPLILGVIASLFAANCIPDLYHTLVHTPLPELWAAIAHGASSHKHHADGWGQYLTLHFLANDILMALFFGIAAKEITEACLPNGALNPVRKAVNPLFATLGGVLGPISVFLIANRLFGQAEWRNGWGIPTATDIALAWLVAKTLFGKNHSAVSFLLLLAVADDAIGLGIIAVGYPDPTHPTQWSQLLWLLPGMAFAFALRMQNVKSWIPYIVFGGTFCWWGLFSAHLHPALALVFIVPFLPPPARDEGLFVDFEESASEQALHGHRTHSTLENFEHDLKIYVDFGLFFFAFANAGVPLSEANGLTWILLTSLIVGKTVGIVSCSWLAELCGFPLPAGMSKRHLLVTGMIAALGLTVALFVSGQAFTSPELQGAAKMGAVFSAGAAILAWIFAVFLRVMPAGSKLDFLGKSTARNETKDKVVETKKKIDQPVLVLEKNKA